jgi:hypothetical protein
MTTIAVKKMHEADVEARNPARPANGWNPMQGAPANASAVRARRVLAMRSSTYDSAVTAPEARACETYAAPASEEPVRQILQLVAMANARRDGARMRTDFNTRLIERSLDREGCASLGSTLQCLLAAGLLVRHSQDEYSVTQAGLVAMARAPVETPTA